MSKNAELQARKDAATPRGVGVMCGFYADHAKNAEIWDVEGNRYIDFAGGIGVLNTGHLPSRRSSRTPATRSFRTSCTSMWQKRSMP